MDWAAVTLAFHEYDSDEAIYFACCIALGTNHHRWDDVKRWLHGTKQGQECKDIAYRFREKMKDHWQKCGCFGGRGNDPGMWEVSLKRGGQYKTVIMPYPEKRWYSDDELSSYKEIQK
jgi:hypothetical protein